MSPVYLYAVLAEVPAGALPSGLAGEPVRLVACDDLLAAVGDVACAPAVDETSLRAHDAAVRRLAAGASALLPARFGSVAGDERALCEALRPRLDAFREGLRAVRGCEQMTLRFAQRDAEVPAPVPASTSPASAGPGTRYLDARRASAGDPRAIPEVARVLDALAPLVRGERRERHERPPLLASVYHLVARESADVYRAAVASAAEEAGLRVTISGPWPPYAFAPDELA
jgi:Gas vesicle synthesis protein GvpL/GvpF